MSGAAWFLVGCVVGGCVAVVAMCLVIRGDVGELGGEDDAQDDG